MRLTRMTVLLPVLLTIAACAPAPRPDPVMPNPGPVAPPVPDTCGAAPFMALVGGPLAAFDATQAKGPVRVIAPGMLVTQEYSPNRINIHHDARPVITRIDCG